jgi:hypothetical protein
MSATLGQLRPEQLFAVAMFVFFLLRTPVEVDLTYQAQIGSVLFCMAWTYLRRLDSTTTHDAHQV